MFNLIRFLITCVVLGFAFFVLALGGIVYIRQNRQYASQIREKSAADMDAGRAGLKETTSADFFNDEGSSSCWPSKKKKTPRAGDLENRSVTNVGFSNPIWDSDDLEEATGRGRSDAAESQAPATDGKLKPTATPIASSPPTSPTSSPPSSPEEFE
jgi:hypothetical protein